MIKIELPFWMAGARLTKLVEIFTAWWALVETWIGYPLGQTDPLTCSLPILKLLAYQRDISPLSGETLDLFRVRVKLAYINAYDAGERKGFENIFLRLGIGVLTTGERFDVTNWDVIDLQVFDNQLSGNNALFMEIIRAYGRTCRRYNFVTYSPTPVSVGLITVGVDYQYSRASLL